MTNENNNKNKTDWMQQTDQLLQNKTTMITKRICARDRRINGLQVCACIHVYIKKFYTYIYIYTYFVYLSIYVYMRICIYIHYNILIFLYLAGLIDEGRSWSLFRIFCPSQGVSPSPLTGGLVLTLSHLSLSSLRVWRERGSQRDRTLLSSRPLAHGGGGQPQSGTSPPLDERLRHPSWWTQRFASDPKLGPRFGHTMAPPSHPPRLRALDPHRGQRVGEAARPGPSSSLRDTSGTRGDTPPPQPYGGQDIPLHDTLIPVRLATDKLATLQCKWMQRTASWRWWAGSGDGRLQHQDKGTPATVLREWARLFERDVLQEGLDEITSVLAIHPDLPAAPPGESPPPDKPSPAPMDGTATPAIPRLPAPTGLMSLLSCTLMSHRPCLRNQRTSRAAGAVVSGWVNPCTPKGPSPPRRFKLLIRFARRFWGA